MDFSTIDWTASLKLLLAVYGLLTAIVKFCPTLEKGILLDIIKLLGKLTNRQTDDDAVRAKLGV